MADQPLGLDAITAPARVPSDVPDDKAAAEEASLRAEQLRAELSDRQKMAELRRVSFKQDTEERKAYATKIFRLVAVWLGLVFTLLALDGCKRLSLRLGSWSSDWHFELSDKVLVALIAGTTVDVIGLFAVVASYLFFRPDRKPAKRTAGRSASGNRGTATP